MRFVIVGLGWAARAFHLPALKLVPEAIVVGGADSSADQRASWQEQTGVPAFATMDELLTETEADIALIATPPDSHAELCEQALRAGLHVVCEKPFVSNLDEADRVLATASEVGRFVAVNHEFREKPIFKALRERVGSEEAGRLVFCQIWQLMDLAPWDEAVPWRAAMPNRALFEGGVHLVDLLLTLYGEPPQAVYARHSAGLDPDRTADAIHLVMLEFSGGRLAQITMDRLCPAGTRYVELRVDCERESLRASLGGRAMVHVGARRAEKTGVRLEFGSGGLAWAERGLARRTLARNPRNAGMHGTAGLLASIVKALQEGREPPSSGREARTVLAVIEAAYRSASTGQRVELAPASASSGASVAS